MAKKMNYKRKTKKSEKPVKNKDFNRKVSTAMTHLAETKHKDYNVLTTLTNAAALTIVSIFEPTTSVNDTGRIGDEVFIKSIHLRYTLQANVSATTAQLARIMIIQWFDETAPVAANIFQSPTIPTAIVSDLSYDRIRRDNNFRVLYDRVFALNPNLAGENGHVITRYLKNFKKRIYFNSGGATPTSGSIYLIHFANTSSAAEVPTLLLAFRTLYIDY